MDRKKLSALQARLIAVTLPTAPKKGSYQYHQPQVDTAGIQKELAAIAVASRGLLSKAKLVRGAKHQEKLTKLAEKLTAKDNWGQAARLDAAALRSARTSLVGLLSTVEAESRKVFIVHGRDEAMRKAVQSFLHQVGLDDVVLSEALNKGDTIIEKFDREARACGYAIVLFSPDDIGGLKVVGKAEPKLLPRARQNVILELGYFVAMLGRSHVFVLTSGSVEMPSDFSGVVYEGYDKAGAWKRRLADELSEAGFYIAPAVRKKL
jgi:predicted nucleotide-binding protein